MLAFLCLKFGYLAAGFGGLSGLGSEGWAFWLGSWSGASNTYIGGSVFTITESFHINIL